jgi:hypothetical protein
LGDQFLKQFVLVPVLFFEFEPFIFVGVILVGVLFFRVFEFMPEYIVSKYLV